MDHAHRFMYESIDETNVKEFKKLCLGIFPFSYPREMYHQILRLPPQWTRLVFPTKTTTRRKCIAAIVCQVEVKHDIRSLCILSIAVDAAYRNYGIGTMLLEHMIQQSDKQDTIESIYLHVHVGNQEAIRLYERLFFQKIATIPNYYRRGSLSPPDCYVFERRCNVP